MVLAHFPKKGILRTRQSGKAPFSENASIILTRLHTHPPSRSWKAVRALLIADVSGKGLGAALLTTMLQGALSGMKMRADPASVFNHINRFLCEHSEVGRYATMFSAILNQDG